jgi:hypothetical protein
MGKAANNERLKLRATFFNNSAVGVGVGGALIPYFTLTQNFIITGQIDWHAFVLGSATIILALITSTAFRITAHVIASGIED